MAMELPPIDPLDAVEQAATDPRDTSNYRDAIRDRDAFQALINNIGWKRFVELLDEKIEKLEAMMYDPSAEISTITLREYVVTIRTLRTMRNIPEKVVSGMQEFIEEMSSYADQVAKAADADDAAKEVEQSLGMGVDGADLPDTSGDLKTGKNIPKDYLNGLWGDKGPNNATATEQEEE